MLTEVHGIRCPKCGSDKYIRSIKEFSDIYAYKCINCNHYIKESERGVYQNEDRGRQLLRFDGMQWGAITPTDIDGLIEYRNHLWIMYEAKLEGKDVPQGQRLALERFIQNAYCAHRRGIAMIVEHSVKDTDKDVYLKDCKVRELITTDNQVWRPPKFETTAKEITDSYIREYEKGKLK